MPTGSPKWTQSNSGSLNYAHSHSTSICSGPVFLRSSHVDSWSFLARRDYASAAPLRVGANRVFWRDRDRASAPAPRRRGGRAPCRVRGRPCARSAEPPQEFAKIWLNCKKTRREQKAQEGLPLCDDDLPTAPAAKGRHSVLSGFGQRFPHRLHPALATSTRAGHDLSNAKKSCQEQGTFSQPCRPVTGVAEPCHPTRRQVNTRRPSTPMTSVRSGDLVG